MATPAAAVEHELARLERPYLFGIHTLWRARVTALLGDRDRTLTLLQDALRQGALSPEELHLLVEFESLNGYPPFEDLTRPRG